MRTVPVTACLNVRYRSARRRPPTTTASKLNPWPRPRSWHAMPRPRLASRSALWLHGCSTREHAHALLAREDAAHKAPVPTQTNRSDANQSKPTATPKPTARLQVCALVTSVQRVSTCARTTSTCARGRRHPPTELGGPSDTRAHDLVPWRVEFRRDSCDC